MKMGIDPTDIDYEEQEDEPIPPHVVKAMSKIAIYAATYGGQAYLSLHDPTIAVPIGVVQEWLKQYGYTFGADI